MKKNVADPLCELREELMVVASQKDPRRLLATLDRFPEDNRGAAATAAFLAAAESGCSESARALMPRIPSETVSSVRKAGLGLALDADAPNADCVFFIASQLNFDWGSVALIFRASRVLGERGERHIERRQWIQGLEAALGALPAGPGEKTLLIAAAEAGDEMSVEWLAPRSDWLATDNEGATALLKALDSRSPECVKALLAASLDSESEEAARIKRQAMVRMPNQEGCTALINAFSEEMVDLLLPLSDPLARDSDGWTALMCAVHRNWDIAVARLTPVSDLSATTEEGDSALKWALNGRRSSKIIATLAAAQDVFAPDSNGESLVAWAIKNGHAGAMDDLIQSATSEPFERTAINLASLAGPATRARMEAVFMDKEAEAARLRRQIQDLETEIAGLKLSPSDAQQAHGRATRKPRAL